MITTEVAGDESRPHYHSHALIRGLDVIKVVATNADHSTLTYLNEQTGYPKSTLVRLLSVLEEEDYLFKVDERPAYRLGHALLPIAAGYLQTASVADLVRPYLTGLAQATGWTANLGILDGADVVHLCVEFPDRPIHYTSVEGSSSEAYCTGLGKAILSELDAESVSRAVPAEPFLRRTANTITTVAELHDDLNRTRERGYAVDAEEADIGLRCLAVPLVTPQGVLGAISVSGPSGEVDRSTEQRFVSALRTTRDDLLAETKLASALGLRNLGSATS